MIDQTKKVVSLALSILFVSFLVGAQTTISNLIWLTSIDMPITLGVFFSSIYHDFVFMSFTPAPPAPFPLLLSIITFGFFISFGVTWVLLEWVDVQKKYAYGIAGAIALVSIVYLMPLIFFGVDAFAGARTLIGKVILIICGYLGGYFFGFILNREKI